MRPPYRVLCIDDNPLLGKLMGVLFDRRSEYHLLLASSAADGLGMARMAHPDVILLDISMPEMDGFEVLAVLRADPATAAVPVVALSAHSSSEDVSRGLAAGFAEYLAKPTDLSTLMRTIARVLRLDDPLV